MSFPDPSTYKFPYIVRFDEHEYYARDVVSFGDPLTLENLIAAYRNGIFPWNMDGIPLPWYCPEIRAILHFENLTIPRSLKKEARKQKFNFTIDRDFGSVIANCAKSLRPDQDGTWIDRDFISQYTRLFELGIAHSVEAWNADGKLVGGLYGVDAGGVFCGESMFYIEPNASKLALLYLIDHLAGRGSEWLDVQIMTPHMFALGATNIHRDRFMKLLRISQSANLRLF